MHPVLFDTSFLVDLQRELRVARDLRAAAFLLQHPRAILYISLITWMEFAEGYGPDAEHDCHLFLSRFVVAVPDRAVAWRAAQLARLLGGRGQRIGDHDLWIAATAIDRNYPLVTRDQKEFRRLPGLTLLQY